MISHCIRVVSLTHRYEEGTPALNGISLEIADNDYVALIGQNGSGKTTLVKHFNGLLKPTSGRVWIYGADTRTVSVAQLARTVGYVFQNPDHQIFCGSTREELGFGPRNLGLNAAEVRARTDEALEAFDLLPYADTPPALLGYGLRRKVALASVYAMRPQVLILDEPTAGLDQHSAMELMRRVDELHATGHTIILVSHDMRLVVDHAPHTIVLHEGLVLDNGPTREVFQRIDLLRRASITPPQIAELGHRLTDLGIGGVLTVEDMVERYATITGKLL